MGEATQRKVIELRQRNPKWEKRYIADEILEAACLKKGKVPLIVGGLPCRGFSIATEAKGGRRLDDPHDNLVFHFLCIVEGTQPLVFVMESVPGMLSKNKGLPISGLSPNEFANGIGQL